MKCLTMSLITIFLVSMLATGVNAATESSTKAITIELPKDGLLSVINPKTKQTEAAKKALAIYYEKAIPLAASLGYQNHGALRVTETVVGNDQPGVFILASWPNEAADFAFESLPEWREYKVLRPQIWNRLNFYKASASEDKTLQFSQNKHYSVAFAWLDEGQPDDYQNYMNGIQQAVSEAGGRFIHNMTEPRFISQSPSSIGPNEITFVEWDSLSGLTDFQNSQGFKQYASLLSSGTTRFELYRITPVIN